MQRGQNKVRPRAAKPVTAASRLCRGMEHVEPWVPPLVDEFLRGPISGGPEAYDARRSEEETLQRGQRARTEHAPADNEAGQHDQSDRGH
jgi:hypothetical protein